MVLAIYRLLAGLASQLSDVLLALQIVFRVRIRSNTKKGLGVDLQDLFITHLTFFWDLPYGEAPLVPRPWN